MIAKLLNLRCAKGHRHYAPRPDAILGTDMTCPAERCSEKLVPYENPLMKLLRAGEEERKLGRKNRQANQAPSSATQQRS